MNTQALSALMEAVINQLEGYDHSGFSEIRISPTGTVKLNTSDSEPQVGVCVCYRGWCGCVIL